MVLNFGAKNFFCFHEGIDISFELSQNCPENISGGKEVANVMCVKGANASGKTNALKILTTIGQFCSRSFALNPEEEIKIETFFNNDMPAEFYLDFIIEDIKYRYELVVSPRKIISEKIFRIIKRETLIIERKENIFIKCNKDHEDLRKIKLRSNASLISTAYQYEINSIKKIYSIFANILSNVNYLGLSENKLDISMVSEFYKTDPEMFEFIKDIIRSCDMGVMDIEIKKNTNADGKEFYFPLFYHKVKQSKYSLTFYNQSSGTRALYLNLILYWYALKSGSMLVMDEFDINFHPLILPKLVELFTLNKANPKNAQFLFTTHNTEIMDVMGKYRTILINKEDNESYGYRLDEIPGDMIRNDRSIIPLYYAGKIGGVPRI